MIPRMPRFILPLLVVSVVGLALSIAGLVMLSRRGASTGAEAPSAASAPDVEAIGLSIPEFTLVDQAGAPRDQSIFDGQVTVVSFLFTHCPFACPMITASMNDVAERLRDAPVRLVSFSVDPQRDTPQRLAEYAQRNGADTRRWTFLTGEQATIDSIVRGALQFELAPDPDVPIQLPDGSSMANIIHPTKLVLVGPDRRVLGFYESALVEDLGKLAARARRAARELKPGR